MMSIAPCLTQPFCESITHDRASAVRSAMAKLRNIFHSCNPYFHLRASLRTIRRMEWRIVRHFGKMAQGRIVL